MKHNGIKVLLQNSHRGNDENIRKTYPNTDPRTILKVYIYFAAPVSGQNLSYCGIHNWFVKACQKHTLKTVFKP
jgi:hypothetical protein